ncbi:MAG: hypothetical protein IH845_04085 [Nanoarchaeota archaeon]|nr:hypothetical protein [Nanoarchaeota archaeon]
MLALAGVPKSVTAKVVTATAWAGLVAKYTVDIRKIARASRGSNVTLTYHGINLEGVRRIWTAAGPLDNMMPGGGLSKAIASTLSELSNSYFDR